MEFAGGYPGSIFVFRVQSPQSQELQFDFRDLPPDLAISVRMGDIGIVASLQDGGGQHLFDEHIGAYQSITLHPLQFVELTAQFFYKTHLQQSGPTFVLQDAKDRIVVTQLPLGGLSSRPLFRAWDYREYAQLLAYHTKLDVDRLIDESGRTMTWLRDENGELTSFDFSDQPWPIAGF